MPMSTIMYTVLITKVGSIKVAYIPFLVKIQMKWSVTFTVCDSRTSSQWGSSLFICVSQHSHFLSMKFCPLVIPMIMKIELFFCNYNEIVIKVTPTTVPSRQS